MKKAFQNEKCVTCFARGDPGWMAMTRRTPNRALRRDVAMKYRIVRTTMRPFILAFRLAEP